MVHSLFICRNVERGGLEITIKVQIFSGKHFKNSKAYIKSKAKSNGNDNEDDEDQRSDDNGTTKRQKAQQNEQQHIATAV
jgi:hypothetical protein